jgi:cellulose synthase operon protein C
MKLSFSCAPLGFLLATLLLVGPHPRTEAAERTPAATLQYKVAAALQGKAEYEAAAEEWNKFLKEHKADPRCDLAMHHLGVCYLMAKQYDQAQKTLEDVVKTYPKSDVIQATTFHLGLTQYELGRSGKADAYDAAASTLATLLKQFPKGKYTAQALYCRGECFYARNKKETAVAVYNELVEKYPDDKLVADALYALGVTQEELQDWTGAGKTYDTFLKKFPEHALTTEVDMRRGETQFAAGDYKAAAARFAAAAAKKGFAMAGHATLRQAYCLWQMKQHAEAADLFASIPAKFPQSKDIEAANLAGGKCYYLADKYAEARKLLAPVLDAKGEAGLEAAHWTARSLLKEKQPAEALAVVEKALPQLGDSKLAAQLLMDQADATYDIADRRGDSVPLYATVAAKHADDPVAPQALYMAAFAALGKEDYNTALKHATDFLAKYAQHELAVDVTHVAAESNLQLKKFDEAETLFAQLLQKHGKHADAEAWKIRQGLSLQLQKKYKEAIAVLQPLLKQIKTPAAVAEIQYLIGISQVELKEYAAAVKSLQASLAASATWRQADDTLLALAYACGQSDDRAKAKETLRKLIADFPESKLLDRAYYRLGEYSAADGDIGAAVAAYEVLEKWPQSPLLPHALYGLGWAKINQKQYADAEKALDKLVKDFAEHKLVPRARYARGIARQQLGKFEPAIADIRAFLAADPTETEKAEAQYVVGLCQVGSKQHAEAAATFEALLKESPKSSIADKAYYELAWALQSQDKKKEAAAAFAKVAESQPDSPLAVESLYHVAEFAYDSKEYKSAAEKYAAAMKKAGKSDLGEKSAHKLGWARFHQDEFAAAQAAFADQRAQWPNGPFASDAAFMEGECLSKQQKYKEALAAYDAVKKPSSQDFEVLTMLHSAQALGQMKQWKKALDKLAKGAKQYAESNYLPEILFEQARAQQNLGQLAAATKLYEEVIAKTNTEAAARAQFMIGEIEFEQKKHADAVKSYYKVIYGYGYPKWQAEAAYEAGRCFEVLGKKPQAVKQYEELIQKYPESDKAQFAKERLKELEK